MWAKTNNITDNLLRKREQITPYDKDNFIIIYNSEFQVYEGLEFLVIKRVSDKLIYGNYLKTHNINP